MNPRLSRFFLFAGFSFAIISFADQEKKPALDVPFEATPQKAVNLMLELANVREGDVVYDLGSGDGRIVITAAREYGALGVGIELDPIRIAESQRNARIAGVADRVSFRREDLLKADIRGANVVALFLSRGMNLRLLPRLLSELKPGTRIISFYWDMDEWKPEKRIEYEGEPIYLWTVPQIRDL